MDVQATLAAVRALALVTSPAPVAGHAEPPRPARAAPRRGSPPAAPPLRLTRRGRVVVVLLAAVVLTVAVSVARVASSASSPAPRAVAAPAHVVRPGETLWTIAYRVAPRADTRVVVARIVALNRLRSADVVPGQAIRLP